MQEAVPSGGAERARAEKRKREDEDIADVRRFVRWFEGREYAEIKRVAGMSADAAAAASAGQAVAKGGEGGKVEDFLTGLVRKRGRAGDLVDGRERLGGTVLGGDREIDGLDGGRGFVVEGGLGLGEWEESVRKSARERVVEVEKKVEEVLVAG